MSFEESKVDEQYFEDLFADAIKKAQENDTVLYCGEYGVIDCADAADSLKWFAAINAVYKKHGIGHAVWSYKEMDFGIMDAKYDGMRDELLKNLL